MQTIRIVLYVFLACFIAAKASGSDKETEQYIARLVNGDSATLKQVSQTIVQSNRTDRMLLDVVAELVHRNAITRDSAKIDAVAWGCRALGESRDRRYYNVLQDVYRSRVSAKIKKYARLALRRIGRSGAEQQYQTGSTDLEALKKITLRTTSDGASSEQIPLTTPSSNAEPQSIPHPTNAPSLAPVQNQPVTTGPDAVSQPVTSSSSAKSDHAIRDEKKDVEMQKPLSAPAVPE